MCDCNDSKFTKLRENWSRYLKSPKPCQCCQFPNNKIKGKFGVAYVIETPNRKCKPCGWEVEFTDTPSTIENNCKKMMNWITCPPLGDCNNTNTTVCACSTPPQGVLCTLNQSCCKSNNKTGCCSKNTRACCCDSGSKPIGCCCANKKPQCCCSKGTNTKPCCSKPRNDSSCCKSRCCKEPSPKSKCCRCCPVPSSEQTCSVCCPPPSDGCCCKSQPQCCQIDSDSDDCCCNQNDSNKKAGCGCKCNCSACKCSGKNKKSLKSRGVSAGSHADKHHSKSKEATPKQSKGSEDPSSKSSKNLNSPETTRVKLKASPRSPYTIGMNYLPKKGPDKEEKEVIFIKTPPASVEEIVHKSQELIEGKGSVTTEDEKSSKDYIDKEIIQIPTKQEEQSDNSGERDKERETSQIDKNQIEESKVDQSGDYLGRTALEKQHEEREATSQIDKNRIEETKVDQSGDYLGRKALEKQHEEREATSQIDKNQIEESKVDQSGDYLGRTALENQHEEREETNQIDKNQIEESKVGQSGDYLGRAALEKQHEERENEESNKNTNADKADQSETIPPLKPPRKHLRGAALLRKIKEEHRKEMEAIHGKSIHKTNPVTEQEPMMVGSDDRTATTIGGTEASGDPTTIGDTEASGNPGLKKRFKKGRGNRLLEQIHQKHREELEAIHHYEPTEHLNEYYLNKEHDMERVQSVEIKP